MADLARHVATSRLLASFVNDRLIDARFVSPLRCRFATFDIPLAHHPVCIGDRVVHLHPEDVANDSELPGVIELLDKIAPLLNVDDVTALEEIRNDLVSSFEHAAHAFANVPPTPLVKDAIAWEQSLVQGHPTHPMHKARYTLPPVAPIAPKDTPKLISPGLRFAAVRSSELMTRGEYDDSIRRLVPTEVWEDVADLESRHMTKFKLIPVHPLQIPNIMKHFGGIAYMLPARYTISAQAQASIRTIMLPSLPNLVDATPGMHARLSVKTALGIKISSGSRTLTPKACYIGPGLHSVAAKLVSLVPHNELIIWPEVASAWAAHANEDIAQHMGCIFRRELLYDGEHAIVCAALVEQDLTVAKSYAAKNSRVPSRAEVAFALQTEQDREQFLSVFAHSLFRAFLPSVLQAGFAFEAHSQNSLLRVRRGSETDETYLGNGWSLSGFATRGFGGIRVHASTMFSRLNETLDVMSGSPTIADSMNDVYGKAHHTLLTLNLQSMVRALGLHYSGRGWSIVREAFAAACPSDTELYAQWMQDHWVLTRSFFRMKLATAGKYRVFLHDPAPNLMMYRGEDWCARHSWPAYDEEPQQ